MVINASSAEVPNGCRLDWYNGTLTNVSMAVGGMYCSRNMTGLANGFYQFRVYASDSAGNWNATEIRQAGIYVPPQPPQASLQVAYSIVPMSVRLGQSTSISVNATSNGTIDRVILTITLPNSSASVSNSPGNISMSYAPPLAGLYNVTIFANTTLGSNVTAVSDFTVSNTILFNSTVTTYNGTGIRAKIEFYYPGTSSKITEFTSDAGNFTSLALSSHNWR